MRFDCLHQFDDNRIVHQTIYATWFDQDDIEVDRWANGKFVERTRGTYAQFEAIRKHFAPHPSDLRYVGKHPNVSYVCRHGVDRMVFACRDCEYEVKIASMTIEMLYETAKNEEMQKQK